MSLAIERISFGIVVCSLVILAYGIRVAYFDMLKHKQRKQRRYARPRESSLDRMMFELVSGRSLRRRNARSQEDLSQLLAS